jgi:hypothetical protein
MKEITWREDCCPSNSMCLSELAQISQASDIYFNPLVRPQKNQESGDKPCDPCPGTILLQPQLVPIAIRQAHGRDVLCQPKTLKCLSHVVLWYWGGEDLAFRDLHSSTHSWNHVVSGILFKIVQKGEGMGEWKNTGHMLLSLKGLGKPIFYYLYSWKCLKKFIIEFPPNSSSKSNDISSLWNRYAWSSPPRERMQPELWKATTQN